MRALIEGLDPWRQDTELLAVLAEQLGVTNLMYLKAHSKEGARLPDPLHIPRPWDKPVERHVATAEELRAMFGPRR